MENIFLGNAFSRLPVGSVVDPLPPPVLLLLLLLPVVVVPPPHAPAPTGALALSRLLLLLLLLLLLPLFLGAAADSGSHGPLQKKKVFNLCDFAGNIKSPPYLFFLLFLFIFFPFPVFIIIFVVLFFLPLLFIVAVVPIVAENKIRFFSHPCFRVKELNLYSSSGLYSVPAPRYARYFELKDPSRSSSGERPS